MTKYFCDLCKKEEIVRAMKIEYLASITGYPNNPEFNIFYDFCLPCRQKLLDFLNNKV